MLAARFDFRPGARHAAFALLLATPAWAQTQWTVDDNGPADFADLPTAVATVAPGDVLLIAPGDYGDVVLDKALSLLGPMAPDEPLTAAGGPDPDLPRLGVLEISDVAQFTLANLALTRLDVRRVAGRSTIHGCQVSGQGASHSVTFEQVDELTLEASHVVVSPADGNAGDAVTVHNGSRVCIVDCELRGGDGLADYGAGYEVEG